MRILQEAIGMRERGHEIVLAVNRGGGLIGKARARGFTVYELSFCKKRAIMTIPQLLAIFKKHKYRPYHHALLLIAAWIGGLSCSYRQEADHPHAASLHTHSKRIEQFSSL